MGKTSQVPEVLQKVDEPASLIAIDSSSHHHPSIITHMMLPSIPGLYLQGKGRGGEGREGGGEGGREGRGREGKGGRKRRREVRKGRWEEGAEEGRQRYILFTSSIPLCFSSYVM